MIKIELLAARIPGLVGIIADHYWLLVLRDCKVQPPVSYTHLTLPTILRV